LGGSLSVAIGALEGFSGGLDLGGGVTNGAADAITVWALFGVLFSVVTLVAVLFVTGGTFFASISEPFTDAIAEVFGTRKACGLEAITSEASHLPCPRDFLRLWEGLE
jgi:hypothetical protein